MLRTTLAIAFVMSLCSALCAAAEPATQPHQREWTFLGANVDNARPELRRGFNIPADAKGAFVQAVMPNSPAAAAGIRQADFIIKMDGVAVAGPLPFREAIRAKRPGDVVTIELLREGEHQTVKAKLEQRAMPETPVRRRPATTTAPSARAPWSNATDVRPEDLVPQPYRVHPGDVLALSLTDLVGPGIETTKLITVKGSGTIDLPLIGSVYVAGMTEEEIAKAIDDEYRKSNI
jgi:hypothetical protein